MRLVTFRQFFSTPFHWISFNHLWCFLFINNDTFT